MKTPNFWYDPSPLTLSKMLWPLEQLYDFVGRAYRSTVTPIHVNVPVICVGNLTVGGTGKTPVVLSLAKELITRSKVVHFLTRGYKGREKGPLLVNPTYHTAYDVGDESLLLAHLAPTWVSVDRPAGARAAVSAGAEIIIMDDGFQNPSLYKDLSILVIDGTIGFGNGRIIPAGPLRESINSGLERAQGIVLFDPDITELTPSLARLNLLHARLAPKSDKVKFHGHKVVAFAGIGRPEKFFDTLQDIGACIVEKYSFPDHHFYSKKDINSLLTIAKAHNALCVTTEKDYIRLPHHLTNQIQALAITVQWEDKMRLKQLFNIIGK